MSVIEISSDSDSDCVIKPQPQPSPQKRGKTGYRARMKEARVKEARDEASDESLSPQQKRKRAAERAQELRIAQQRRRREEKKQVRRQQAVRQASVETVVATPSAATSFAAGESPGSQPWHQHVPADDALANSPNLPFPLADSLPAYNLAAASSSPASADEQPETGPAATSMTTAPFPREETSVAVAQGETLAPAGSALEENPKRLSPGVSDSSGDVAQQQQVLPRRSTQTSMHQTRREHAAPATTTTTTTTRVRAVMLHWGRLWRHPRQLYRHWLGRPLFRRVERADDEAVQQV